jgi:hypothetical protein
MTTAIHLMLLHDAAIIVKYIFIFHLKNPTVIQDDFWNLFINLWIFIVSLISQIIFQMLPGRDPMDILICCGKMPKQFMSSTVKRNYPILFAVILSIIVNIYFFVKKFNLKYFKKDKYAQYEQFYIKWTNPANKENFFHYTTHFTGIAVLFFCLVVTPQIINSMNPQTLDSFPYYILFYAHTFVYPQLALIITISFTLLKNNHLRSLVFKELKRLLNLTE